MGAFCILASEPRSFLQAQLEPLKLASDVIGMKSGAPYCRWGVSVPALSIAGRVHSPTMAYVSRSPPIIPDTARFPGSGLKPWLSSVGLPKFGEV